MNGEIAETNDYFEISNSTMKFGENYTEDSLNCKEYTELEKVN